MNISTSHETTTESTPKGAVLQTVEKELEIKLLRDPLYHLSMQTFSRGKNRNILAAVAYRAGCVMLAENGIEIADYTRRRRVLHTEIALPSQCPAWATHRNQLWIEAANKETRVNSTEGREIRVAIPYGLKLSATKALCREFAEEIVGTHQCAVDFSLHADNSLNHKGEIKNLDGYHAHFMLTTRRLTAEGFTEKTRELDETKHRYLPYWRKRWEEIANKALAASGRPERIDCRSNRERGIANAPTKPLKPSNVRKNRQAAEAARKAASGAPV